MLNIHSVCVCEITSFINFPHLIEFFILLHKSHPSNLFSFYSPVHNLLFSDFPSSHSHLVFLHAWSSSPGSFTITLQGCDTESDPETNNLAKHTCSFFTNIFVHRQLCGLPLHSNTSEASPPLPSTTLNFSTHTLSLLSVPFQP